MIALSLEVNNLITSRMLALALMEHLPNMVRDMTTNQMIRQDEERAKRGEELTNRDELMVLAREEESRVLTLEAELRAPRVRPLPMQERLNFAPNLDATTLLTLLSAPLPKFHFNRDVIL